MALGKILVVDDDRNLVELIQMRLEKAGYDVVTSIHEEEAIEKAKGQLFDLAVVDLQLVNTDGISLMEDLHRIIPEMPVIILTAYGSIESAVDAIKRGAYSYLTKPFEHQDLLLQIQKAVENRRLTSEIERLKGLLGERFSFANVVTRSERMQKVLETISRIAPTESTVLLLGESGTGKEVLAKAIHRLSDRSDKPFVAVNCAAIPENLLESELFGYEKGAFTGASQQTKGKIEYAHNGTFFLDEIGDLPFSLQSKLLRFLQERTIERIGGRQEIPVNVRIICATHQNLQTLINEGKFRLDLYYRISEITINIPPLREREGDAITIATAFLRRFCELHNKKIKSFSKEAAKAIETYSWPGNIRELENKIKRAVIMTDDTNITFDELELEKSIDVSMPFNLKEVRDAAETLAIKRALTHSNNNISNTARLLGITRPTLYTLFEKYGIHVNE